MNDPSTVLTAEAVEKVVFDPARFPARGYNEDQVDEFLDEVVATIQELNARLDAQRREIDRLKHWRQRTNATDTSTGLIEQHTQARADSIISAARVSAEEIRKLALANARHIEEQARQRARELLDHTPPPVNRHHRRAEPDLGAPVAEIVDRLHQLRDGLTAELRRLTETLDVDRQP